MRFITFFTIANPKLRQQTTGKTFEGGLRGVGGYNERRSGTHELFEKLIEVHTLTFEPTLFNVRISQIILKINLTGLTIRNLSRQTL